DGPGRAVRDRREIRVSRSRRHRDGRRWRDADERQRRAHHHPRFVEAMGRSAPGHPGAEQSRPDQVTWEQRVMEGDPRYDASQEVFDFPYARYAELIGLKGIRVDAPAQIGEAWDAALRADRPCVIE